MIVPFYDDGTHGDEVAGDGTFTALYTPGTVPFLTEYGNKVGILELWIVARDSAGTVVRSYDDINYLFNLAAVDRAASVPLTRVSDTEFTTTNLVNYIWPGINSPYHWDRGSITRRLLASYPDVFDFVTIRFAGIVAPGEVGQNYVMVSNRVQGIGISLTPDGGLSFGSGGTLRGVLQMGAGSSEIALMHEIGHSACFYLDNSRLPLSNGYGHINRPTTLLGQDNFSPSLLEQEDGNFLIGGNPSDRGTYRNPYSKLELYLMGLIGPTEVTPERFLLDPTVSTDQGTLVPRGKTTLVTIDDLVAVYGPRVPDATSTAKTLRVGFVVLSDRPLMPAEVALEHLNATWAESRPEGAAALQSPPTYHWATGGRGTLLTTLPARKP